ncbi:MAG: glycoside hydrolase family 2 TIM barrel-domain containing protein [Pseudomonadota bacterium]
MLPFKRLSLIAVLTYPLCIQSAAAADVYPSADPAHAQSLNGDWKFRYIGGSLPGPDAGFTSPQFDVTAWATIPVPANWELKGFAEPFYADELKEGLGLYRRTFRAPASWHGRRAFLRFEGVAFGYEVWVNGKKAGESSASAFNRHTFDVTDLLLPSADADNVLAVRVMTRPHGYEFDLNDDWSLSGIYRDVSLFSVPATHLRDLSTATKLRADGSAVLSVDVALSQPEGEVGARLIAPDGRTVSEIALPGRELRRAASISVPQAKLWTTETPSLYRLRLTVSVAGTVVQTVEERIGLRELSIANAQLLLNGKPIKMRGVNHHDLDPARGRAVTREQIRADLELMKKGNVNFVRTSHYPPHPALLELCDELGLYVMDEVSIGHGEKNLVKPEYRANILARVEPTILRDKNRASVLIWSIGNENPITDAELEAGRLAKQLDPSRPVTFPKIGSYFAANHERIPEWVEIHAPHYPANSKVSDYARTLKRPTIFTEYAHALGLATDRMQDQWELIQKHPVFAGGAIWHFMDQGIVRVSAEPVDPTKPTQLAWLDKFRYYDTHGLDGTDGVTYADRTPQTDYWQMRKVYAPVRIAEGSAAVQPGTQQVALNVENRYDFRALGGIGLHWSVQRNGKDVQQGKVALKAAPRSSEAIHIPVRVPANAGADVLTLKLRAVDELGLQITERTVALEQAGNKRAGWTSDMPRQGEPQVTDNAAQVRVTLPQWVLTVQRATGELTIRDNAGKVLVAGIYPHSGRKATMAEALRAKVSGLWLPSALTKLVAPEVKVEHRDGKLRVAVSAHYPLPADAKSSPPAGPGPAPKFDDLMPGAAPVAAKKAENSHGKPASEGLSGIYELEISPNGTIAVRYDFAPVNASGILSEAGLSVVAPAAMGEFRWIGQGPYAGYPGKDILNEFGLFHLNREDLYFKGNRRGTELAMLSTAQGSGFAIALAKGDVSVERDEERTLLSHNALIGSLGNKGTSAEQTVPLDKVSRIAGAFTLVPVGTRWPAALERWFGKPAGAKQVFRPFLHSYDQ